jgi:hypothetical protein
MKDNNQKKKNNRKTKNALQEYIITGAIYKKLA